MPRVSTLSAREIPRETSSMVNAGYLLSSMLGNMDNTAPNLAILASIVHASRMLGRRADNAIKIEASKEMSTTTRGIKEEYVSIKLS